MAYLLLRPSDGPDAGLWPEDFLLPLEREVRRIERALVRYGRLRVCFCPDGTLEVLVPEPPAGVPRRTPDPVTGGVAAAALVLTAAAVGETLVVDLDGTAWGRAVVRHLRPPVPVGVVPVV